LFQLWHW